MYICFKFNLMKKILLLITFISTNTFAQYKEVPFKKDIIIVPEVHMKSIANIGESLFINKNVIKKPAIEILSIPQFKIYSIEHHLSVGDILPLQAIKDNNFYYYDLENPSKNKGVFFGIMFDTNNNKYKGLYSASATLGGIGVKTKSVDNIEVKEIDYLSSDCNTCYSYEFIYNGKSNNTLKFIYREFIKDLARPSFTQELQYNLDESNIVGFKNMRLEVVKATNSEIEYKILQHLS